MAARSSKPKSSTSRLQFTAPVTKDISRTKNREQIRVECKALDKKLAALKPAAAFKLPTYAIAESDDEEDENRAESFWMAQQEARAIPKFPSREAFLARNIKLGTENSADQHRRPARREEAVKDMLDVNKTGSPTTDTEHLDQKTLEENLEILSNFRAEREKHKLRPITHKKPPAIAQVVSRKRGRPPKTKAKSPSPHALEVDEPNKTSVKLMVVRRMAAERRQELEEALDKADRLHQELTFLLEEEDEIQYALDYLPHVSTTLPCNNSMFAKAHVTRILRSLYAVWKYRPLQCM
ncbi:hypothetical protein ABW20_dc0100932 [Dactylellina cionopaga]|nr:hypothetical protein ABW20_dc0100932 [Dactylellina cionopaga]